VEPTGLDEVQAERSNPFEQAVQCRLVKLASDDRDRSASRNVESGERPDRRLVEPTRDADLIGRGHKSFLRILCSSSVLATPILQAGGTEVVTRGG
jgi:hypothetical protein